MEEPLPVALRFSALHRAFRRKMDALLREKDLTGPQFCVLGALVRLERQGEEEISQHRLEQLSHTAHPTMVELLKRLEKKGFLRCEQSARDRRCKCIRATDKAYRLGDEVAEAENQTFSWLCRGLSPEQVEQLLALTDRMLRNAREDSQRGGESDCV